MNATNNVINQPTVEWMPAASAAPVGSAQRRTKAIGVILVAVFVTLLDLSIVNVAFPALSRYFGESSIERLSWILNGYTITFAALLVPAGRWADRVGRKRLFLWGLGVFTGASALCAISPSLWLLIAARLLQAAGAAMLSPAAMGLLLMEFTPQQRSSAVALFAAVGGVAAALGAPAGGILAQLSWRLIFLVNLPIGVVALLIGRRSLIESRDRVQGRMPDLLGALILALAVGIFVLSLTLGDAWGWVSIRTSALVISAALLLVGFLRRSAGHPVPVVELPMLKDRSFALANAGGFLFSSAFAGRILGDALFIGSVWRTPNWLLGLELIAGPMFAAIAAIPAGRLSARFGPRPVAMAGAAFFAFGCIWLACAVGPTARYLGVFFPGAILSGLGIGLSLPSISAAALQPLPAGRLSTGSGILNMARQLGMAVGVAILVAVVGDVHGADVVNHFHRGYAVLAAMAVLSFVACAWMPARGGRRASSGSSGMGFVALKMLTGDRVKYLGLVFAIAFATFLLENQTSIFAGIMKRTGSQIADVTDAEIWVMDPKTEYFEQTKALKDTDLTRVRGVDGVAWATRLFKGTPVAKTLQGRFAVAYCLGVDDSTLAGVPRKMLLGSWERLREPDSVVIDKAGYLLLYPGESLQLGRILEINDHKATIVGISDASAPFASWPVMHARYSEAVNFVGPERTELSYVLVRPQAGVDAKQLCVRIEAQTGLRARTTGQFRWDCIEYYLKNTGIPVNFGITIGIALIVGTVVAGQTFYLFTVENLKQFGALKAVGVTNRSLLGMVLLQAISVGAMGFSLGTGMCAAFFDVTVHKLATRGMILMWQNVALTGGCIIFVVILASIVSLRRVLVLEPAIVFRS